MFAGWLGHVHAQGGDDERLTTNEFAYRGEVRKLGLDSEAGIRHRQAGRSRRRSAVANAIQHRAVSYFFAFGSGIEYSASM
jgi:hypothetical protein